MASPVGAKCKCKPEVSHLLCCSKIGYYVGIVQKWFSVVLQLQSSEYVSVTDIQFVNNPIVRSILPCGN
jgi:hypothetical protein